MENITVMGTGRLTKDIAPNSEKGGNFTMAFDIGFGGKATTDFVKCFVSQETMEHMEKAKVKKGSLIQVLGTPRFTSKKDETSGSYVNNSWINVRDWTYQPSNGGGTKDGDKKTEPEAKATSTPAASAKETSGKAPDFKNFAGGGAPDDDEPY